MRGDHAVEFSGRDDHAQSRTRDCGGMHGDRQAGRADAVCRRSRWPNSRIAPGLPPGVFNVVPADESNSIAVGKVLCESDVVRKLSFTGSTAVGRILMQQSAPTLKKLSLELGGNAPFIVFEDAAVDAAVEGASRFEVSQCGSDVRLHQSLLRAREDL